MDDGVPRTTRRDSADPAPDLRLAGGGGTAAWTVDLPGATGEVCYEEPASPPPDWFDMPDTDG